MNIVIFISLVIFFPSLLIFHFLIWQFKLTNKTFWLVIDYTSLFISLIGILGMGHTLYQTEYKEMQKVNFEFLDKNYNIVLSSIEEDLNTIDSLIPIYKVKNIDTSERLQSTKKWLTEIQHNLVKNKVELLILSKKELATVIYDLYKKSAIEEEFYTNFIEKRRLLNLYDRLDNIVESYNYSNDYQNKLNGKEWEKDFKFWGFVLLTIAISMRISKLSADQYRNKKTNNHIKPS